MIVDRILLLDTCCGRYTTTLLNTILCVYMRVQVKHSYEAYKNLQQELVRAVVVIISISNSIALPSSYN
jgi:hypothetical protein